MSKFTEYLEAVSNKKTGLTDKTIKESYEILEKIFDAFKKANYPVSMNKDYVNVTNKKEFDVTIKYIKGKLYGYVQGFKTDIDLGEIDSNFTNVKKLVDSINKTWMKENDPYGDQW